MNGSEFEYDIGFLGGGQLARMSIQAAQRMGLRCLVLDPDTGCPASQIAALVPGAVSDGQAIRKVLERCFRATLENEFIPGAEIRSAQDSLGRRDDVVPSWWTLSQINDKLVQRGRMAEAGVPSPRARPIGTDDHGSNVDDIGFPMVIKSRFGGYDGKGTRTVRSREVLETFRPLWSEGGWLAEQFVPFKRELAVMVYRSEAEVGTFPTMETVQTDHVCDLVFPAGVDASDIAIKAVEAVEGYGLFGVELFELEDGSFQVNEIAPRPHNTGHYTLDWGGVSQFEQHVRLVMGWPCAKPEGAPTCMANLLGQPGAGDYRKGLAAALEGDPDVRVHWYGKAESRPGRKMGHLNVVGADAVARAIAARERFYRGWTAL
ncbi:MAG: ATP-grasp domain-containing protein [Armatimonadetes bacterium]|nr:ATP-grasp domain-containing protein [Armatimonadota bacterium]